ncbi:MAG: TldD/PmbA family protein [Candidatus Goldiibacteriota bacterium]
MPVNTAEISKMAAADFDIWDIYSEKSATTMITYENSALDRVVSGIDRGFGIRGVKDFTTSFGFTNDEKTLPDVVSAVAGGKGRGAGFKYSVLKPEAVNTVKIMPDTVETAEKIRLLSGINDKARSVSAHIKQVNATYMEKIQDVEIINDLGFLVREKRVYTSVIMAVIAEKNGRFETAHTVVSGYGGFEIVQNGSLMEKAAETAGLAHRLLGVDKKINGEMTVVMSSSAGGTMIHEAVGHSLEADLVQKDMSGYKGKKGQQAASPLVTVVDDALLPNKRGSYSFDDEGMPAQKTVLIEKGILKNFLYDRAAALKDGVKTTAAGRRESYRFKPIPRMRNTMIMPGESSPADVIKDTKSGMFVKRMGGGQVNTVTGDFVFEVKEGYMIENGKVTEPLRDAVLMGKGEEVLNTIDAVCDDLGFEVGTCGKDGQGVPVSDAQPTIRIPKILIGSK